MSAPRREATAIVDSQGRLTIEGWGRADWAALADDLLAAPTPVNCGRPAAATGLTARETIRQPIQLARVYHDSVVDGPGRRSVIQLQGCARRCPGCYVPETHDHAGGQTVDVLDLVDWVRAYAGDRDGVTILGGEPTDQPRPLWQLVKALRPELPHLTLYTGHTVEALVERGNPYLLDVLRLVDLVIDGPFVQAEADGAGEWRGSRNQRLLTPRDLDLLIPRKEAS